VWVTAVWNKIYIETNVIDISRFEIWKKSHCDILTFRLESSLLGSTFVFNSHFGPKTISSQSHFEDDSSPHISGSSSLIWINLMFVQFKHVILWWINYLETWLCSDNTSCYYTGGLAETQGFLLPLVDNYRLKFTTTNPILLQTNSFQFLSELFIRDYCSYQNNCSSLSIVLCCSVQT